MIYIQISMKVEGEEGESVAVEDATNGVESREEGRGEESRREGGRGRGRFRSRVFRRRQDSDQGDQQQQQQPRVSQ